MDSLLTHGLFALPEHKRTKHLAIVKKLLGKLLKKLGPVYVKKVTPAKHVALIDYIERARRKRANKTKKEKLMALLGKEMPQVDNVKKEEQDSEDDIESSEEEDQEVEEHFSDDSDSSSDEESEDEKD